MMLELGSVWSSLRNMWKTENQAKCLIFFEETAESGFAVFRTLHDFFEGNQLPKNDNANHKPMLLEGVEILNQTMEELKRTAADGQTFALASDYALDVYYDLKIVLPRKFEFLTENSNGLVDSDPKSLLTYDLFLPFNNKLHKNAGCVPVEKLPLFYQEHW